MNQSEGRYEQLFCYLQIKATTAKRKSISVVKLNYFTAETLFSPGMLDAYKRVIDEVTGYELKTSLKRKIGQDRESEIDWLSIKKICQATDVPKSKNRQEKDCKKKEQKAVNQWKTHGHLPRQLAVRNI